METVEPDQSEPGSERSSPPPTRRRRVSKVLFFLGVILVLAVGALILSRNLLLVWIAPRVLSSVVGYPVEVDAPRLSGMNGLVADRVIIGGRADGVQIELGGPQTQLSYPLGLENLRIQDLKMTSYPEVRPAAVSGDDGSPAEKWAAAISWVPANLSISSLVYERAGMQINLGKLGWTASDKSGGVVELALKVGPIRVIPATGNEFELGSAELLLDLSANYVHVRDLDWSGPQGTFQIAKISVDDLWGIPSLAVNNVSGEVSGKQLSDVADRLELPVQWDETANLGLKADAAIGKAITCSVQLSHLDKPILGVEAHADSFKGDSFGVRFDSLDLESWSNLVKGSPVEDVLNSQGLVEGEIQVNREETGSISAKFAIRGQDVLPRIAKEYIFPFMVGLDGEVKLDFQAQQMDLKDIACSVQISHSDEPILNADFRTDSFAADAIHLVINSLDLESWCNVVKDVPSKEMWNSQGTVEGEIHLYRPAVGPISAKLTIRGEDVLPLVAEDYIFPLAVGIDGEVSFDTQSQQIDLKGIAIEIEQDCRLVLQGTTSVEPYRMEANLDVDCPLESIPFLFFPVEGSGPIRGNLELAWGGEEGSVKGDIARLPDFLSLLDGMVQLSGVELGSPVHLKMKTAPKDGGEEGPLSGISLEPLQFDAEKILVAGITLENTSGVISFSGEEGGLSQGSTQLYGGNVQFNGSFGLGSDGSEFGLDGEFQEMDLSLLSAIFDDPVYHIEGNASGKLSIELKGEDLEALELEARSGPEGVTLSRMLIEKILFYQTFRELTEREELEKALASILGDAGQYPFESGELKAWREEDRVLSWILLDSPQLRLEVEPRIDIPVVVDFLSLQQQLREADWKTE